MLFPGYNYHITVDDRATFKMNFKHEFIGDGWYIDESDSLYAVEVRSGIRCFVFNNHDPRDQYLALALEPVRKGSGGEPKLEGVMNPATLYRLARHVFKALDDFPNPPADENFKKEYKEKFMEDWEVALKDAVDADPHLPNYEDLPEAQVEYLVHYYGDAFDAARKSASKEELPPGTGVAAD